jgi:hypothetical protein
MDQKWEQVLRDSTGQIARFCPLFWHRLSSRRYILPAYRREYADQEFCNGVLSMFLEAYLAREFGERPNSVLNCVYFNYVGGLNCGRPIYFLERELGEALMRTRLPDDLAVTDFHWRHQQLRIMLPSGLMGFSREGVSDWLMYLDIAQIAADKKVLIDPPCDQELKSFAIARRLALGKKIWPDTRPVFQRDGVAISGQLAPRESFGIDYGIMKPIEEGLTVKDVLEIGEDYKTEQPCDETDDDLLARMQHLAFNILVFLGSYPLEYDPERLEQLRKPRQEKDRLIPGLYNARFVGKSQYRPAQRPPHSHIATFSGRHLPQHWRCGHWKRQWYGPKKGESKLIWIEPYQTLPPQPKAEESTLS